MYLKSCAVNFYVELKVFTPLIKSFAKGISRSRSSFVSEGWHGLLPFSWQFYLVYGVFSDVKDLKNILMWMVVLELKG